METFAAITDTHALIWYLSGDHRLSPGAQQSFEEAADRGYRIGVPVICIIEIIYLVEKGKIPYHAFTKLMEELQIPGSVIAYIPLNLDIALTMQKIPHSQVPDMPDRMIAATAHHLDLPLITRDNAIICTGLTTIW